MCSQERGARALSCCAFLCVENGPAGAAPSLLLLLLCTGKLAAKVRTWLQVYFDFIAGSDDPLVDKAHKQHQTFTQLETSLLNSHDALRRIIDLQVHPYAAACLAAQPARPRDVRACVSPRLAAASPERHSAPS